jgi:GT2 family glycosyltransferase
MKRICILILGPHRSGTSALARTVSLLGADLPANLLDPQPDNPTGFWESNDHMILNDELLARMGLRWDSFLSTHWNLLDTASFVYYRDRIVELLYRDFESSRLFVIKDPRLSRLLPIWRAALARFGAAPKCILTVRHPLEVAKSLNARDGIALQAGLRTWLRHLLEAEGGSRDLNRVFVSYEFLLNNWQAAARRISQALDIEWPRALNEAATEIEGFLRRDARHHLPGELTDGSVDSAGPIAAVRRAYEVVCAAAQGDTAEVGAVFDGLRDFVSDSELAVENEHLRSTITQLRELLSVWERELSEKSREIANLQEDAIALGSELKWREGQFAANQQSALALAAELKWSEGQIAANQQSALALAAELKWSEGQIAANQQSALALAAELKWREGQFAAQIAAHIAQNEELQRIRAAADQRIAQLGTALAELRGSLSWRLTAPLREANRFWERLARTVWPRESPFDLQPASQLRSIEQNLWEAQGSDPQFLLIPRSRPGHLPTRWCELAIQLDHPDGVQEAILCTDAGDGLTNQTKIMLPQHERGELRAIIELPHHIRALRFIPRQQPGRFEIGDVVIQEITHGKAKQLRPPLAGEVPSASGTAPPVGGAAPVPTEMPANGQPGSGTGVSATTQASADEEFVASNRAPADPELHTDQRHSSTSLATEMPTNEQPGSGTGVSATTQASADEEFVASNRAPADPELHTDQRHSSTSLATEMPTNEQPGSGTAMPATTQRATGEELGASTGELADTELRTDQRHSSDAPLPAELSANERAPDREHRPGTDVKSVFRDRLKAELSAFLTSTAELLLPQPRSPQISIVLVLYNQAELTYNCLCSIIAHAGDAAEVIIVDNASTDDTTELLKRVRGAIVLRNRENLYFPHGCNQGMQLAHGKYLLFFNNDAQLLPGSLQAAVDVLEHDETVGAVGGRILNLNGQLQEAGCIVWSDGSTLGYGRGDISNRPQYMFRRDVDFCSAAFLLTRTGLFEKIGGFDEVFSPAYYEEVDFCTRLWKHNFRVVYEPRAAIVHFEYGSADSAYALTLTARNRQIFQLKHADYLVRRQTPDEKNVLRARHAHTPRLRILFIDDRVPNLDQGSGYPRANAIANAMVKLGAAVTVFPMTRVQEPWQQVYRDLQPQIEVMTGACADSLAVFLKERRGAYDAIFVSRPHNMRHLLSILGNKSLLGRCRLIYDAEAVFALRIQERARVIAERESETTDELVAELELAAKADDVVCVSEIERRHFVEHGVRSVYILGHSLEAKATINTFEGRRDILFVGAMNTNDTPNEDSVRWFTRSVLPLIRARLATENIRLVVVGQNTAERLSFLAHEPVVEVVGSAGDLSPYYERARIFVAPTRFGAGIPIKILEAAARGVPVVATSLMAAQLGWVDGEHLLATPATDPEKFADQCIRLYSSKELWLHLREQALRRSQEDCDPDRFEERLKAILGQFRPLARIAAVDDTFSASSAAAMRPSS